MAFEEKIRIRKGKDKTYHLWFLIRKAQIPKEKAGPERGGGDL